MKKFALTLTALAAVIFGFGATVNAYPPGAGAAVVTPPSVQAGGTFTVTVNCADAGDSDSSDDVEAGTVSFTFNGTTKVADCDNGVASVTFTAPSAAGTYTGTYTGAAAGTFSITVTAAAVPTAPSGGLPSTGSNGTSTMTIIALGLFAVGAGLFGVSQVRRRTTTA